MEQTARIGFAGTPQFACTILAAMLDAGYLPCVVYTQPDRPSGRGRSLHASPVKALAESRGIIVETPRSLRPAPAQSQLASYALDLLVVAAYGLILPDAALAAPRLGCLNVHASLLPRWRGAAPIERAIIAGDVETGISLMQMDTGLDTGPVHHVVRTPIDAQMTGGQLETKLAQLGSSALIELLPQLETSEPTAQSDEGVTYANKLTPADSVIDWRCSAAAIERQVRALSERAPARSSLGKLQLRVLSAQANGGDKPHPQPGAIVELSKTGLLIACGRGELNVTQAQLNRGKGRPLSAVDLFNGYAELLVAGQVFEPAKASG